jgi:hypothetical protein
MKLTNRLNLPQPIVDAVKNDSYEKGKAQITVTGLIRPPRIRVLEKMHADEIEEDVSDLIYSMIGQVVHGILERANATGIAEKRVYAKIDGVMVGGEPDIVYDAENGTVEDYKYTTMYKVRDGVPMEYEQQLNCYAALLRYNGYKVNTLRLRCILRDWSKMAARREPDLPQQQIVSLDVKLWPDEDAVEFIRERIRVHKAANKELPDCTDEERWATPTKWATMVKDKKRAAKLHDTKEAAEEHAANIKEGYVQFRPGENKRCDHYCSVSKWCAQYQQLKEKSDA